MGENSSVSGYVLQELLMGVANGSDKRCERNRHASKVTPKCFTLAICKKSIDKDINSP